jgi:hypothetical protein
VAYVFQRPAAGRGVAPGDLAVSLFGLGQSEIRNQRCVALQVAIIPADSVKDGFGYK